MILKWLTELGRTLTKKWKIFLKIISLENTITGVRNILEKINNRQYDSEEWISDLEDRVVEIT